jgi:hypothetical protein
VPELEFSLAKILSFLLEYRQSLEEGIANVLKLIKAKLKPLRISKDAKPKDT